MCQRYAYFNTTLHLNSKDKLEMISELFLSYASAHDASGRGSRRYDITHLVDNLRATPLLMRQRLDTVLPFLTLDQLNISTCATFGILASKKVNAERIGMEARQSDELPAES